MKIYSPKAVCYVLPAKTSGFRRFDNNKLDREILFGSVTLLLLLLMSVKSFGLAFDEFQSRQNGNWNSQTTWIKGLTGTSVSFTLNNTAVTGTGTLFTAELTAGDVLMLQSSSGTVRGTVLSITDDTHLTLTANASATASGAYGKQAIPSIADGLISIAGHTITVNSSLSVDQVDCNIGSVINVTTGTILTIADGTGTDLVSNNTTFNIDGTFIIDIGAVLTGGGGNNASTGAINVSSTGTLTVNGTINKLSSSGIHIYINGNGSVAGTITAIEPLDVNSGGILSVTGSISLGSVSTLNVNAGGLLSISGAGSVSATRGNGGNVIIVSGTITLSDSSTISPLAVGTLTINSGGTVEFGPLTKATGNNFVLSAGGNIKIGSTAGIASSGATGNVQTSSRSFSTAGKYFYNGISAQVTGSGLPVAAITGNVTISNTAGVTPSNNITINTPGNLIVDGLLTPAPAQLLGGTGTLSGSGTAQVTRIAATADLNSQYTITNKTLSNLTVEYAGAAAQIVSALTYGSLKISNTANVSLSGSSTVNGTLTFSNGKINTGVNTLVLGSSASITGASAGKYVNGNLLWNIPSGSPSRIFEIGDASAYTPVSITFASVSSAGTLLASTTAGDHPNIGTSGIPANRSVNRFWTITNSGTIFTTCDATFNFVAGDVDVLANTSNFSVRKFNSPSTWSSTTTGALTATSTQATGITSFSDFQIGELCVTPYLATAGSNTPLCAGSDLNLSSSISGGFPPYTFAWTGPSGFTSSDQNPVLTAAPPTASGTYTVTVSSICGSTQTSTDVVVAALTIGGSVSPGYSVCTGSNSGSLTLSGQTGNVLKWQFSTDNFVTDINDIANTTTTQSFTNLTVSTSYRAEVQNGTCSSAFSSTSLISVGNGPPPGSISTIINPEVVCTGNTFYISVNQVAGATSYTWDAPPGTTINGFPAPVITADTFASVTFGSLPVGTSGYNICVYASSGCGNSNTKCCWIRNKISTPQPISGSVIGCPSSSGIYSVLPVEGTFTYTWSITGDAVINGGGSTLTTPSNSITLNFGPGFTGGTLCVFGTTICGTTSGSRCLSITLVPAIPGAITGNTTICPGASDNYSIVPVAGANSYTWSTTGTGLSVSGTGTTASVTTTSSFNGGSVCVIAVGPCGNSPSRCKTLGSGKLNTPGNITGDPTSGVCSQLYQYSIPAMAGATNGYLWTVPPGVLILSAADQASILLRFPANFTSGQLCVAGVNSCGPGFARCVSLFGNPATPAAIFGNTSVCFGATVNYSWNPVPGASSYQLTAPAGATIIGGAVTSNTNVNIQWGNTSGNIGLKAINACGNSGTRSLAVNVTCRLGNTTTVKQEMDVNVYPNPATDHLTIRFNAGEREKYLMRMMDPAGRQITESITIDASEGINYFECQTNNLAGGIYLIILQSEKTGITKIPVIIQ